MDPQVRTSFIPKKPILASAAPVRASGSAGSIFFLISLIIFLASVLAAGGAYAYAQYLTQSITTKADSLNRARAAFEPATIQELIRLDDRLSLTREVLAAHVAPSSIFALIGSTTLETVRFSKFAYRADPSGAVTLTLEGQTNTFSDVALQSDAFGKVRALKNTIFGNFNVGQTSSVTFSVHADVDPIFISYKSLLDSPQN